MYCGPSILGKDMKVIFSQGFYVAKQFHVRFHVDFYTECGCEMAMELNYCSFNKEGSMN